MEAETRQIAERVYQARSDAKAADQLIADYMPFIKSETSKFLKRPPDDSDDELSIAMFAFFESIRSCSKLKGAFLPYAAVQIRRRLIDNYRRERRNSGNISLDSPVSGMDREITVGDTLQDKATPYEDLESREATRQEIAHLTAQMAEFGVALNDVAENAPQQQRTLAACQKAVSYARAHPELLEEFLRTKKIPITKLAAETGTEKKTLERHRRYLVAVLLMNNTQTNSGMKMNTIVNYMNQCMKENHFEVDPFYYLNIFCQLGILTQSDNQYVFYHQIYQDYYCSQQMLML